MVPRAAMSAAVVWSFSGDVVPWRSRQTRPAAEASPHPATTPRVALVTGSTDGLGREVARRLAASGAHVIIHGRNRERGLQVVQDIQREGKGSARFFAADFASLAQVRAFGDSVLHDYDHIDVLVNNAGIWLSGDRRTLSADSVEMHFAVNYLAGYLLTRMLLPRLVAAAPSRIVNVSSGSQTAIRFDDVMLERGYSDARGYAQSKLAQVMFTVDLAEELAGRGVTVAALHPATYMNTTMVVSHDVTPQSTVEEGAAAVLHLIDGADVLSGRYYVGLTPGRPNAQALDAAARSQLRALSERLVKKN